MIYYRNVSVFYIYRFEQDVAVHGIFLVEIRSITSLLKKIHQLSRKVISSIKAKSRVRLMFLLR